jgi:hypothetical protein
VGSLNLCLKKSDSMQKESAKSDHPARSEHPQSAEILGYLNIGPKKQNSDHILDFFPGLGYQIKLIPTESGLLALSHYRVVRLRFHFF